jgi:Gas vesicle protein
VSEAPRVAREREEDRHAAARSRRDAALERSRERRDANMERAREKRAADLERVRANRAAKKEGRASAAERARREREVSLLEMIDRLLAGGVVIHGDITLAVADVDLLYVGLRAIIASVDTVERDLVGPLDRPRGRETA